MLTYNLGFNEAQAWRMIKITIWGELKRGRLNPKPPHRAWDPERQCTLRLNYKGTKEKEKIQRDIVGYLPSLDINLNRAGKRKEHFPLKFLKHKCTFT